MTRGEIDAVGGVVKRGAGTLTLTGDAAFSGEMALRGGTLKVTGTSSPDPFPRGFGAPEALQ